MGRPTAGFASCGLVVGLIRLSCVCVCVFSLGGGSESGTNWSFGFSNGVWERHLKLNFDIWRSKVVDNVDGFGFMEDLVSDFVIWFC